MPTPIDWNDREDTFQRATGSLHVFQLQRWPAYVLEIPDLHFDTDSAVLLPDAPIDDIVANETALAPRMTAFSALAEAIRHAGLHPTRKLLVAGHADTQGNYAYNVTLSGQRAKGVSLLLRGQRDPWRTLMHQKNVALDKRTILTWLAVTWGWDCDPRNHTLYVCIQNMQRAYNDEFTELTPLIVDGDWQRDTWGAVYDIYTRELAEVLDTDEAGLDARRPDLKFIPQDEGVGCGEHFPIDEPLRDAYASETNRRVELVFFEEPQAPEFPCHPGAGRCVPAQCRFYHFHLYDPTILPAFATPPRLARVPVHLRLTWGDPEGVQHPFPADTPVKVVYDDGSSVTGTVGEDGAVDFNVSRRRAWFRVMIPKDGEKFIASAPTGSSDTPLERRVPKSGLAAVLDLGFRAWKLPDADVDFVSGQFTVTDASFDAAQNAFRVPPGTGPARIGTRAARVPVALDPRWQYLKFLYWDRWLKQRLSILPVMLKGWFDASAASGAPDTASNWTTAVGCQCVPWVIRTPPRPDAHIGLEFVSRYGTFIFAEGNSVGSRKLKSQLVDGDDPFDVFGEKMVAHSLDAGVDRLRYYDLPRTWRASKWHCRIGQAPASGATPAGPRSARFEDLAGSPTSNTNPLMFSLDDMVITDETSTPTSWVPNRRCAIFSATFAGGANLSDIGLYKPDTANNLSYVTQLPSEETDRNYLSDYPDWTRVVVADGRVHVVFDGRTDAGADVVGARAALRRPNPSHHNIRRDDSDLAQNSPYSMNLDRNPRPTGHVDIWQVGSNMTYALGYSAVIVLRMCDVRGGVEHAVTFTYFPVLFDFAHLHPNHSAVTTLEPAANHMNAAQMAAWQDLASRNIMHRWNGPDGSFNPGRPRMVSTNPGALPMEAQGVWFLQPQAAAPPAPFAYGTVYVSHELPNNPVRSFMSNGTGFETDTDNVPRASDGWFTAAHEFGHGSSRNDEYMETTSSASLRNSGVVEFHTGSPYALDTDAIMNHNKAVRGRNYWHLAEYLRRSYGQPFELRHDGKVYTQPAHPTSTATFDSCPFAVDVNATHGAIGRFTLALNTLGDDRFSNTVLSGLFGGGARIEAMVTVVVKIEFQLRETKWADMIDVVDNFLALARRAYDEKYLVTGSLGGQSWTRCALKFSPRALVSTLPTDNQAYLDGLAEKANATAAECNTVITNLRTTWGTHFVVVTHSSGNNRWDAPNRTLHLNTDDSWKGEVPDLFADMLGVARAQRSVASTFDPIVQKLIPGATTRAR